MSLWIYERDNGAPQWGPYGVPVAVEGILRRRGISSAQEAEDFLSPAPRLTHDPKLLPDAQAAAESLIEAADRGKRICVYGDYDADGVTSAALIYEVLGRFTDKLDFYIPSRFTEGYGLNRGAVERIRRAGADMLVTVDCGSTNGPEVAYAKELGMEVIVTDHHALEEGREPDCLFVNSKRGDSEYPFKGLSGCGTVFKIVQCMQRKLAEDGDERLTRRDLSGLLDLVAISTVADVVPLLDENRSLVKYGLHVLNSRKRPGIRVLLDMLGLGDKVIDAEDIAYIIAPHINSCGRMKSAVPAVELLAGTGSEAELCEKAAFMAECNRLRRSAQDDTAKACETAMAEGGCGSLFTVIEAPGAHEGVAGIVAGSLKEELYRPVCIVTPSEGGMLKGTGRCVAGLDLHGILSMCGDIFERYGGHAGACGFLLKEANLRLLRSRSHAIMEDILAENPDVLKRRLNIEKKLGPEELGMEFAEALQRLEPYGEANPRPLFVLENAEISGAAAMGKAGNHVRFTAAVCGTYIGCVLFGRARDFMDILTSGLRLDIAGELGINEFNGKRRLQFTVKDIKENGK